MTPQPQLATASGVQQLAGQQGLPAASPPPAPLAKLGGEIMQVAKLGKGRRAQSEKRKPARANDLFGMLRGNSGRPFKRANLITGGQMPAWAQEPQPMPQAQASGNFFTRQDLLAHSPGSSQPQMQQLLGSRTSWPSRKARPRTRPRTSCRSWSCRRRCWVAT